MSTLATDLRYAIRMLWKDRRFTFVALVALALGIGATSAIYTVVDSVLLRPLPFPEPAALVDVQTIGRNGAGASSYADFVDFRARNHSLTAMAAYGPTAVMLTGHGEPQKLDALTATPELFTVLGVQPLLGRAFAASDAVVGSPSVILSYALWQGRYRGDPDIIGRSIALDARPAVVIGVMPPDLRFPLAADASPPQIFVPFPRDENDQNLVNSRGMHAFAVIGRLAPSRTAASAQSDFDAVATTMRADHPSEMEDKNLGVQVQELRDLVIKPVRPALLLLLVAVACVLVIACTNVAGLLLARATVRQREVAIRSTLGATRGRIVRQLLTESALLGVVGGAAGLLLALWLVDLLLALVAPSLPHVHDVGIDARVLGVTTAISVVSSMAFGLVPALHASRVDLQESLKETTRSTSHGSRRTRNALLVAEIAVALMLLFGAGLTLRSFASLRRTDPGFRAEGLVLAQIDLPVRYAKDTDLDRYYRMLSHALESVGSAEAVAIGAPLPFSHEGIRTSVHVAGQPVSPALSAARIQSVSPSYLATMGIPLVRGRNFTAADDQETSAPTVIVSQEFVKKLFPNEEPIGKRIDIGISSFDSKTPSTVCEIVGVAGDIRRDSLAREVAPAMYVPIGRLPVGIVGVVARSRAPGALLPELRQTILGIDPDLPPTLLSPMAPLMDETIRTQRMLMIVLGLFAALALVLSIIGVYGVMSYSVTQRRREIGIRVAVGARLDQILALVLGESLRLAALGVAIGVAASLAAARLLRGLIFGVSESDPMTLVAVAALLVVVTVAASFVPAWRATRVDPMEALRDE